MEKNVGNKDKTLRLILAVVLFPLLFLKATPLRWIGLAAIPLALTGLTQRCGAYALIGTNTCEKD